MAVDARSAAPAGGRPPVQPAVPDPAGRGGRRREDRGRRGEVDRGVLPPHRQVGDHHGPGGARVHRQPAAGGAVAGGAAHGGQRGGHRRADRRLDHRGPGLRWAFHGPMLTFHLAGGPGGMAHMLDHFGPVAALAVDPAGRARAHPGAARRRGPRMRRGGRQRGPSPTWCASATAGSSTCCACWARRPMAEPLVWAEDVRPEWIDYNGHLSEAYYVLVFGHATDAVMGRLGMTPEYLRRHRHVAVHARGARALPRPGSAAGRGWRCAPR